MDALDSLEGKGSQVGVGRSAVNQSPAQSQWPYRQRQPQPQPEARALRFGSTSSPFHSTAGGPSKLSNLGTAQVTDRAVNHCHNGGLEAALQEQTETTLQEAKGLLRQEAWTEDEKEATTSLHGVQDRL